MNIDDISILVITAAKNGTRPLERPVCVPWRPWVDDAGDEQRALATLVAGSGPVFTAVPYAEWLEGRRPDPAVVYGGMNPCWDEILDDPEYEVYEGDYEGFRFDPGFTEAEREQVAKLVINDQDCGWGMSMFNSKGDYDAYPLRTPNKTF